MLTRREALATSAGLLLARPAAAADAPAADPTRVLPAGQKPADARLGPPRHVNGYFPFEVPQTLPEWEARRAALREQVKVALGLWPMPEKTPLNPTVHGKIERDGYTIEKVSFASMPGHYVTGSLYRPLPPEGRAVKHPAVLCAHGHWKNGRFEDAGGKVAEASIKAGGETDVERGRYFMQALPATLAKLGFVAFQYDMVGIADSTAIPHREGFKDAQAELRLQSFMGLQTWNSVRALDFVSGLPDVDPQRIGMTGGSGGGTQTFVLGAVDDRLAAIFPAVMVSTAMQGGCVCENASLLRVGTGNVELAALFAPKPLAMSAANDWTKELMTKGFPELQKLYKLYGAEDKVAAKAWLQFGHQYNQLAREFMYAWFSKHLLGKDESPKEPPLTPVVPPTALTVYDDAHPRPKDELPADKLREVMTAASDARMAKLAPTTPETLKAFRDVVKPAMRAMVGEPPPATPYTRPVETGRVYDLAGRLKLIRLTYSFKAAGEEIPILVAREEGNLSGVVVWVHPKGKASLLDGEKFAPLVQALVDKGYTVVAPDVYGIGELSAPPLPVTAPTYNHVYAGYTYGYNRSVLANRVHDILSVIRYHRSIQIRVAGRDGKLAPLHLVGWGEAGPWVVLAKALAGDAVAKTAADLHGFRFEDVSKIDDPMMLPGAVKYGGLAAALALCAPGEVLAHNTAKTGTGRLAKAAYDAAGAKDKLAHSGDKWDDAKVVAWLLK